MAGRGKRRSRWGRCWVLAWLLVGGCARPLPPPGGPADTTPPRIVAAFPESLSVQVPVDAAITVTFSEKVDRASVEASLWVAPGGLTKPKIHFSGNKVSIRPGSPFPDSTTVGVLVTTGIRDRHGRGQQNSMAEPYRWIFSTGDSLWRGRITGTVEQVGTGSRHGGQGQVLVALYPGEADTVPDPVTTDPEAITQTLSSGRYELTGLPTDGKRRWLFALFDADGNHEINGPREFVSAQPESVFLSPVHRQMDLPLRLVNPNAPAELSGSLTRAVGDTVRLWVGLYEIGADSTATAKVRAQVAPDGSYRLPRVAPGRYKLGVFCDANQNGRREAEEPTRFYEDIVVVEPGAKQDLGERPALNCTAAAAQGDVPEQGDPRRGRRGE